MSTAAPAPKLRQSITHLACAAVTYLDRQVAAVFDAQPTHYSHAFCRRCSTHYPVGQFVWTGTGRRVGS